MGTAEISFHSGVPPQFRLLCWQVFFASRLRGVSIETHFPWMDHNDGSIHATMLQLNGNLIGGAVVRVKHDENLGPVGLIGLVCIAEKFRGAGNSHFLLDAIDDLARELRLEALILWTQKHSVYSAHGFIKNGTEFFGTVISKSSTHQSSATILPWPDQYEKTAPRGLPPFARNGYRLSDHSGSAIILQADTPILAEWKGPTRGVAGMLLNHLHGEWRINTVGADDLPQELAALGCEVLMTPTNARMVKFLSRHSGNSPTDIRLLDRI